MNLALLADRELAERGEREKLWFEERWYTNRELHDASCQLAGALSQLGLGRDDRVVVLTPNCPEVLISYPAIWRIGAVVVPVLFMLEAHELAYILQNSKAKAIITTPELLAKVRAAQGDAALQVIAITEGKSEVTSPVLSFERLLAEGTPLREAVQREPNDLAVLIYTSGTTGNPKGVMQTHHNLSANAHNIWSTTETKDPLEIGLVVLPLAHTFGLSVLINGYLFGGQSVLMRKFTPNEALSLIARHRVTNMSGVPTMYMYMLVMPGEYDTSSVRRWIVGAAPMPMEQLRKFEQRFGGQMHVGYGLTEASPTIACERESDPRKPGSAGRPLEGVRVKIVDEAQAEVPTGTIGEICAAGENVTLGYLGNPVATAESFRDGWLHTGDMGYLDEDGYLFVVERKKDLIIRGGLNIYPKDVEEVLYRHPAIAECAVVGVPDLMLGEQVCACVVLKPSAEASADGLIAHCQEMLAKYKTPKYVEFMAALPKTPI
ncbi:MAG: acyl-CoA synthetase/AMP-acid ligase, partial [Myxococcaceae bacterium]|nr:acyl-CoA synthetase/AMP-acid ligase [Myxococcaceae bacterium]